MMKFFIILALIFGFFVIGTGLVLRKVRSLFMPFNRNSVEENKYQNSDILYKKDDIVVMKGDAGKHKD